jgi:hypothetical protein
MIVVSWTCDVHCQLACLQHHKYEISQRGRMRVAYIPLARLAEGISAVSYVGRTPKCIKICNS